MAPRRSLARWGARGPLHGGRLRRRGLPQPRGEGAAVVPRLDCSATGSPVVLHAGLVPRPVPRRPAARRRVAVHHHVPRPMFALGPCRGAVARHPAHDDPARPPLVPVRAPLRVTPPVRALHPHATIRTRERLRRASSRWRQAARPASAGRVGAATGAAACYSYLRPVRVGRQVRRQPRTDRRDRQRRSAERARVAGDRLVSAVPVSADDHQGARRPKRAGWRKWTWRTWRPWSAAEDVAAIIRQQQPAARPAIEED
jgi:hypothetical protein